MQWRILIPLCATLSVSVLGQEANAGAEIPIPPPGFKALRFEEDYSYLTNAANRADVFDPMKNVSLRSTDPSWYLTVGGEVRERFEGNYDPDFGIPALGSDSFLLQRIALLTDVHLGERVRFFVEGISGIVAGESLPPPSVQQDPIDLQFAFAEFVPYLDDDARLTLRAGRFGMSFGAGRLVATRAAVNIPFRFDGFEARYSSPFWNLTAFITQPVKDSGGFDGEDQGTTFWGLYNTHYLGQARTLGLDVYYFGIHRDHGRYASGSGDEIRHSIGAREFGSWNHWDWDAEQVVQFGTFGSESILAWTAAINAGYTFDATLKPRLGLKTGIVSGDHDPHDGRLETFDALFFKSGYFNDASLIRPANLLGLHPNVGFQLSKTVSLDGGADWFWRYSRNDAVYGVPGFVAIPPLRDAPNYIGTALDVNLTWQLQRHLTLQASYVHFLTGSYVHEAGGKDVDYVSSTLSFLF